MKIACVHLLYVNKPSSQSSLKILFREKA